MALGQKETAQGEWYNDIFGDTDFINSNLAVNPSRKRRKTRKSSRKTRYVRKRYRKSRGKKRTISKGNGRVRHTKHGQPYIILRNGRARFIKKR